MEFKQVSSWTETDSFEDLFHRLKIKSLYNDQLISVSNACDTLYGQSWTEDVSKRDPWQNFRWKSKDE